MGTIYLQLWMWSLFLVLLLVMGLKHPPVRDLPPFRLGLGRQVLGWATLLLIVVGLTPEPVQWTGL
ncbi:MAG: hypothetical protein AAF725_13790 [Acidobacteriota bacterium]